MVIMSLTNLLLWFGKTAKVQFLVEIAFIVSVVCVISYLLGLARK